MMEDRLVALGWPEGMDDVTVEWLTDKIGGYLLRAPMPEWLIQRNLSYENDAPEKWRKAVMLDWQFQAIRRACREIKAELVWRSNYRGEST